MPALVAVEVRDALAQLLPALAPDGRLARRRHAHVALDRDPRVARVESRVARTRFGRLGRLGHLLGRGGRGRGGGDGALGRRRAGHLGRCDLRRRRSARGAGKRRGGRKRREVLGLPRRRRGDVRLGVLRVDEDRRPCRVDVLGRRAHDKGPHRQGRLAPTGCASGAPDLLEAGPGHARCRRTRARRASRRGRRRPSADVALGDLVDVARRRLGQAARRERIGRDDDGGRRPNGRYRRR